MAKEVAGLIKLQVKGGAANPSPPIGPALGAKGVNIMEFCKKFNAATQWLPLLALAALPAWAGSPHFVGTPSLAVVDVVATREETPTGLATRTLCYETTPLCEGLAFVNDCIYRSSSGNCRHHETTFKN